jgi:predicted O-methyltransferase YrrM
MSSHHHSASYDNPLLAELYDASETETLDVELLQGLIGDSGPLNILECFSGTGRILIPLVTSGHRVTGIEIAPAMAARAVEKIALLEDSARNRATIKVQDVLASNWGAGFDLVVLGANSFYELPSPETQERCIEMARSALRPGGKLFVDNNDYKGGWGRGPFGQERVIFEGAGDDGTYGRWTLENLRFDEAAGVLHMNHRWHTRTSSGEEHFSEYLGSKHPVTASEVSKHLDRHGFHILEFFGDRSGNPHTSDSQRAIFWAQKR